MTMMNTERQSQTRLQWLAIRLQNRVAFLPRLLRMLMAFFFAVALLIAVFPLIDDIYIRYFYDPTTLVVPSLIGVGIAGLMYSMGWYLLVGTRGDEKIKQSASIALVFYFMVGVGAVVLDIFLIVYGLSLLDATIG